MHPKTPLIALALTLSTACDANPRPEGDAPSAPTTTNGGVVETPAPAATTEAADVPEVSDGTTAATPDAPAIDEAAPDTGPETTPDSTYRRGTVRKVNDRLLLTHQSHKRICLPQGLFQKEGLIVRFEPSAVVPIRRNERRMCNHIDASALSPDATPEGMNTLTLTAKEDAAAGTFTLTTTRRVPRGPSAMGSEEIIICNPGLDGLSPGESLRATGYPDATDGACQRWVFTAITRG